MEAAMREVHQLKAAGFGISPDYEETMHIYAQAGTKVIFRARGGYDGEKELAKRAGLVIDQIYTVKQVVISRSDSRVTLEELPGRDFNTCLFADVVTAL
jgi:hypothetical protein